MKKSLLLLFVAFGFAGTLCAADSTSAEPLMVEVEVVEQRTYATLSETHRHKLTLWHSTKASGIATIFVKVPDHLKIWAGPSDIVNDHDANIFPLTIDPMTGQLWCSVDNRPKAWEPEVKPFTLYEFECLAATNLVDGHTALVIDKVLKASLLKALGQQAVQRYETVVEVLGGNPLVRTGDLSA